MNRIHLVLLWHMHQPQYRDPATGSYVLPWTRLHALKDYWGMVRILEEFPGVHVTFNVVPSLAQQLEDYSSGEFDEPWFQLAFLPAEELTPAQKIEVLERAFQVNREKLMSRWPRYVELFDWVQSMGVEPAATRLGLRDCCDLQLLSQLAWMDEEYLAGDPVVSALSRKGADFNEDDKLRLRGKQMELLARVLPEYRRAADRGQVELSTTPFYHPILPLLVDSDVARVSSPQSPLPQPAFRFPEDAREQLQRARRYHERVFGQEPHGLWPSEGSVSDDALEMAAEMGFGWFATDEGVLGRTLGIGFGRDAAGVPDNATRLYSPLRVQRGSREIIGVFRDHYLSDLIGFVYSRMDASAAASDLHRRLRQIAERVAEPNPLTVSIILDGENAWEYYPGNGREFLRQFYRRIEADPDIRALTVSEAIAAARQVPTADRIFPGSWINANFDIWIGHDEDVRAWELLGEARRFYAEAERRHAAGLAAKDRPEEVALKARSKRLAGALSDEQLARAYEALLAAEGSDWCWWYGPEHSTPNDADFDALYRKHLTAIYASLGAVVPDAIAEPIKKKPERALVVPPSAYLSVQVDGRISNYFEWLGAGLYSAVRRSGAMHGRLYLLHELYYGFDGGNLYVRVDPLPGAHAMLSDCAFRVTCRAAEEEVRVTASLQQGRLAGCVVERNDQCLLHPGEHVAVAYDNILELSIGRELLSVEGQKSLGLGVVLWHGGLPLDLLPGEGLLEVKLGEDNFSWPLA